MVNNYEFDNTVASRQTLYSSKNMTKDEGARLTVRHFAGERKDRG